MSNPLLDMNYDLYLNQLEGPNRVIAPFLACGDLSGYDSDKTYKLQVSWSTAAVCYTLCSYLFLIIYFSFSLAKFYCRFLISNR